MFLPSPVMRPADRPSDRAFRANSRGPMSDLLSRIATDRSEEAFRRLFDDFAPRIKSYMMRQGAEAALAEELAQETLLTVWRKAALYSPEKGNPSTWIFTIARNLRIDRLRRETNWQELTEEHAASIPSDEAPPDDNVSARQRQMRVQAVLGQLPQDQLEAVTLAFIDGLSHSEISERLGLPLGTVKSRIRLAYQKVRTALEDLR
jgi:RNA polymerase sigma-70 factor (ECF subfamily)